MARVRLQGRAGSQAWGPAEQLDRRSAAFVAVDDGTVLVYQFGYVAYHVTEPKILADELRFAKPLNATAAQHMTGG